MLLAWLRKLRIGPGQAPSEWASSVHCDEFLVRILAVGRWFRKSTQEHSQEWLCHNCPGDSRSEAKPLFGLKLQQRGAPLASPSATLRQARLAQQVWHSHSWLCSSTLPLPCLASVPRLELKAMPGLQEAQKVRQPPEIPSALRSARPGDRPTSYLLRMTNLAERGMMPGVQTATPRGFPRWWTITGYVLLAAAALFAGRIIYEETILTWNNGPQMVGFALAHGAAPVFSIAGLIALPGGSVWVIGSLILLLRRRFRIKLIDSAPVILYRVAALLCIPSQFGKSSRLRLPVRALTERSHR